MTSGDEGRGGSADGMDAMRVVGYSGKKGTSKSLQKCWMKGDFLRKTIHYLYFKQ